MKVDELLSIFKLLETDPSLITKISNDRIETPLGVFQLNCDGNCVQVTLHNDTIDEITVIGKDVELIANCFASLNNTAREFGVFILKKKMEMCYENISRATASDRSDDSVRSIQQED